MSISLRLSEACAKRETREEAGIEIENIQFLCLVNMKEYAPKHFVNIVLTADWKSGEPEILEPEKCESWSWYEIENPPIPLFKNVEISLQSYKTGKNYFDRG